MKKVKGKILGVIGVLAVLGIYYYAALPAFNIHSMEFWILLIVLLALQLMRALGVALPFQPVSGCTMMIECTFLSFMTVQAIRTKT